MEPQIAAAVIGLIGTFAVWFLNFLSKRKEKQRSVERSIENDKKIAKKLKDILLMFNADRVKIFRFHNGGAFFPKSQPMKKFSCAYEIVGKNIAPSQIDLQNMLISFLSGPLSKLLEEDQYIIRNVAEIEDEGEKSFFSNVDGKSIYLFPIYNSDDVMIAFFQLSYLYEINMLNEEQIEELKLEVASFAGYLE